MTMKTVAKLSQLDEYATNITLVRLPRDEPEGGLDPGPEGQTIACIVYF